MKLVTLLLVVFLHSGWSVLAMERADDSCDFRPLSTTASESHKNLLKVQAELGALRKQLNECNHARDTLSQSSEKHLLRLRKELGAPRYHGDYVELQDPALKDALKKAIYLPSAHHIQRLENILKNPAHMELFDLLEKAAVSSHIDRSGQFKALVRSVIAHCANASIEAYRYPLAEYNESLKKYVEQQQKAIGQLKDAVAAQDGAIAVYKKAVAAQEVENSNLLSMIKEADQYIWRYEGYIRALENEPRIVIMPAMVAAQPAQIMQEQKKK